MEKKKKVSFLKEEERTLVSEQSRSNHKVDTELRWTFLLGAVPYHSPPSCDHHSLTAFRGSPLGTQAWTQHTLPPQRCAGRGRPFLPARFRPRASECGASPAPASGRLRVAGAERSRWGAAAAGGLPREAAAWPPWGGAAECYSSRLELCAALSRSAGPVLEAWCFFFPFRKWFAPSEAPGAGFWFCFVFTVAGCVVLSSLELCLVHLQS